MTGCVSLLLIAPLLIAWTEAACTGTNAFCSLISNETTCIAAGCVRVNSQCADPASGKVPCDSIATQGACDDARCNWRDITTSTSTAPQTQATSRTPVVPLTTAFNSATDDEPSPELSPYVGMIVVIVVVVMAIIFTMITILMVCVRRRSMNRAMASWEIERNVIYSAS